MVRCVDNSIYTGITTDIARRMYEHKAKKAAGAKYTKSHTALKIEAVWECDSRAAASKLEYRIKRLSKAQKEKLITDGLPDDIDGISGSDYSRVTDFPKI
ncbi:MAG: GIY-YIG nuclease family protein [Clostridia bacterium]|nr:GIY-YIG nuclease family protein [Clostridia bacterium]